MIHGRSEQKDKEVVVDPLSRIDSFMRKNKVANYYENFTILNHRKKG